MPIELKMPALSPTMEKGRLARWLVGVGDVVKAGDLLAEIETDKATMEFEAVEEGTITSIMIAEGTDDVSVGTAIATIAEDGEETVAVAAVPEPEPEAESVPADVVALVSTAPSVTAPAATPRRVPPADRIKVSPLAARLAQARGLDLTGTIGSGPNGRIVRADLGITEPPATARVPAPAATSVQAPALAPMAPPDTPHEAVKLSTMRRTIARRLTEAKQTVPHFYLSVDCHLDALLALRTDLNGSLASRGVKLSVNDFLIKALARALEQVHDANVQFAGDLLYRFSRVDIAMAVAIEGGLLTPVIKNAAPLSLSAISRSARELADRARNGKLQPADYEGGTASLSNLGMFGIRQMVPVINPPQAVIMGIGAGEQRANVTNGILGVATTLTATGSFDHRAIDGAVGAELMAVFKAFVETPLDLLA